MAPLLSTALVEPEPEALAAVVPRAPTSPPHTPRDVERARAEGPPPPRDPDARVREIAGPDGPLTLRMILPERAPRALRICAHAGGWCFDAADRDDLTSRRIAEVTGIATASIDYRLAPEHPHPAALHDVIAGVRWALGAGREELGVDVVIAAGASAGAHLMLGALLALGGGRPLGIAGLELRYGCFDLGLTPSLRAAPEGTPELTAATMEAMIGHLLPGMGREARRDPALSPLGAELEGLPPALLSVGDRDALRDDTTFLAMRLACAGVRTELELWRGCGHVFDELGAELREAYADRVLGWLARSRMIR